MTKNFHVSLPCKSIEATKRFYQNTLKFEFGRETLNWIDVNMYGNQITFVQKPNAVVQSGYYSLDAKPLPVFHLGIILDREEWSRQFNLHKDAHYLEIEPIVFVQNKVGEHDSFFIKDPNGYYLEFKTFNDPTELFKQKTNTTSDS